jgi:putative transcriptional regulator
MNLVDHFLISMPNMADPNFAGTVIYVCEHSEKGAMGVVINRPTELTYARLFDKIELALEIAPLADRAVFFGGPVQTDRGFVLHEPHGAFNSSLYVGQQRALTTSKDVLESLGAGNGPHRVLITLGYSGWGAGQLESELAQNAWLTVAADTQIIFDTPPQERFTQAIALLGIDLARLSPVAGRA